MSDPVDLRHPCHCRRQGIGPHWYSLAEGCPRDRVEVVPPCAHGYRTYCDACVRRACPWVKGEGCVCTEDDPAERAALDLDDVAPGGAPNRDGSGYAALAAASRPGCSAQRAVSGTERAQSGTQRRTTRAQFREYLDRQFAAIRAINASKGRDYTGEEDALANLRDRPEVGLTGGQVLWVYLDKHLRAIQRYILEGQVESEPIEGRIHDAVLYLLLLGALVEERDGAGAERDGAGA